MMGRSTLARSLCLVAGFLLLGGTVTDADTKKPDAKDADYDLSRIVSIGGDVTEILYQLGLEANIVAVDTTSQYPASALKTKPNVGYMRALSSEGVLSMKPTLILASKGAGPSEVVSALQATSIPYVEISNEPTAKSIFEKISAVAKATDKIETGRALSETVQRGFDILAKKTAGGKKRPRILFVLLAKNGRAMVGGKKTVANALFDLAGFRNAAQDITGFRPVDNESALAMQPDLVVTMARGKDKPGQQAEAVKTIEGLRQTDAVKLGRVLEIDGAYMLGFGPRLPEAALELRRLVRKVLDQDQALLAQ